ncbi:lysozyme inhibitor LprI family protein [Sphingobium sp. WCS2017Hpa-17]|uniref:lysozyme inhibitor LprI family protein n=1 Tax=Sphingobium sp. WCS2017Hpa-17 TaxID=3073638 RepID=UPI00288ABDDD|nr:lysozyme inhibitor LprI family protein [Sphingobium sp. WCS2017Hpa-17]
MRFLTGLSIGLATIGAPTLPISAATPASSCDKPGTGFDSVYCERQVFMQADTELNSIYAKLRTHLSTADRLTLRDGQRAWIRQRDRQCSLNEEGGVRVNIGCARDQTIQRTNWLNDRLRECVSSGCRSSKLGE